jgi:hypothetical protein
LKFRSEPFVNFKFLEHRVANYVCRIAYKRGQGDDACQGRGISTPRTRVPDNGALGLDRGGGGLPRLRWRALGFAWRKSKTTKAPTLRDQCRRLLPGNLSRPPNSNNRSSPRARIRKTRPQRACCNGPRLPGFGSLASTNATILDRPQLVRDACGGQIQTEALPPA